MMGATAYQVWDCTTPHGACAERGRANTGKAIEKLVTTDLNSKYCVVRADGNETAYRVCLKEYGLPPPKK